MEISYRTTQGISIVMLVVNLLMAIITFALGQWAMSLLNTFAALFLVWVLIID